MEATTKGSDFSNFWTNTRVSILCISPYSVQMRENAGKMQTRLTPITDTFYALQKKYINPNEQKQDFKQWWRSKMIKYLDLNQRWRDRGSQCITPWRPVFIMTKAVADLTRVDRENMWNELGLIKIQHQMMMIWVPTSKALIIPDAMTKCHGHVVRESRREA